MVTDWVLFRRAAHEIEERFRGARVRDAGLLPDGRLGLLMRARAAGDAVLAIDAFGTPPSVTIEDAALGLRAEPGFVRALHAGLCDTTLLQARARRGDRVLRLVFGSRSRFGVGDELDLYVELVPRFGNVVLVKGDVVVAAAKEFALADNGSRAVAAGMRYAPPPARPGSLVPKAVRDAGYDEAEFLAVAQGDAALSDPLYVYRDGTKLLAAHVVALPQFGAEPAREPSVLALLREMRAAREGSGGVDRTARRRAALIKRLDERERKLRDELHALASKRSSAERRDDLRAQGERIFAELHDMPEAQRDDAKDRAAKLFAQYKKLGAAIPHVEARERLVRAGLEAVEDLRWETERAAEEMLDDVEAAVAQVDAHRRRGAAGASRKRKRRAPLEYRTAGGSRIVVGRSPAENADVTFTLARPNDLWFHAQGIPGAHVILARDDRDEAPPQDIETAAALAALYSKAKGSAKIAVDYTLRKHVRKRQDAPPGLVWYTHPKTVLVAPGAPDRPGDA